jgi:hypothetical protein
MARPGTPIGADYAVVGAYAFGIVIRALLQRLDRSPQRRLWIDFIFLVFSVFLAWTLHSGTAAVLLRRTPGGLVVLAGTSWGKRYVAALARRPILVLLFSFAGTIAVGTVLLTFAIATEDAAALPADRVVHRHQRHLRRGLTVVDTPTYFSRSRDRHLALIRSAAWHHDAVGGALRPMGRRLTARQRHSDPGAGRNEPATWTIVLEIFCHAHRRRRARCFRALARALRVAAAGAYRHLPCGVGVLPAGFRRRPTSWFVADRR